jgi:hypothetical protein
MNCKGSGWDSHTPTRDPLISERSTAGRFTVFPEPELIIPKTRGQSDLRGHSSVWRQDLRAQDQAQGQEGTVLAGRGASGNGSQSPRIGYSGKTVFVAYGRGC